MKLIQCFISHVGLTTALDVPVRSRWRHKTQRIVFLRPSLVASSMHASVQLPANH